MSSFLQYINLDCAGYNKNIKVVQITLYVYLLCWLDQHFTILSDAFLEIFNIIDLNNKYLSLIFFFHEYSVMKCYNISLIFLQEDLAKTMLAEFNLGCTASDFDHTYRVYVSTFLGFGANTARERYERHLLATAGVGVSRAGNATDR